MVRIKFYLFKKYLKQKKYYFILFFGLFFLIIFLSYYFYNSNLKKEADNINIFIGKNDFSSCKKLLNIDFLNKRNKYLKLKDLKKQKKFCIKEYSIENIYFSKNICKFILNEKKQNLSKYFFDLNNLQNVKKQCISKYKNLIFDKNISKNIILDFYYPKKIYFKDKIGIKIRIYNLSNLTDINIKYKSDDLEISNLLNIKLNDLVSDYTLYIKNNKIKQGFFTLKIKFDDFEDNFNFFVLKPQKIFDTKKVYFGTSKKLDDFLDFSFKLDDFNIDNTKVLLQFYNNDLLKLKDIYYSLNNGISNDFYLFFKLQILKRLILLNNKDLNEIGLEKKIILDEINFIESKIKNIKILKNATNTDFIKYSYYYIYFLKNYPNLEITNSLKIKLYTYLNNKLIEENQKLDIYMILSGVDKKLDLRFIDYDKLNTRHELLAYTIALYNIDYYVNKKIILKNIEKLKDLFNKDRKTYGLFNVHLDEILFYNLLKKLNHKKNINYLDELYLNFYKKDFLFKEFGIIEKYYYLDLFLKNYLSFINNIKNKDKIFKIDFVLENYVKTHFGFMIGNIRNKNSFWLGNNFKSFKEFKYNLKELTIPGEETIDFRAVKLKGVLLKVNIIFRELIKNNKNVILLREIYEKTSTGTYKKLENNILQNNKEYKIVNIIKFKKFGEKNDVIIKDFIPGGFKFIKSNNFNLNSNNILEIENKKINEKELKLSYIIKTNYSGEYSYPGFIIYSLSDSSFYGISKEKYIIIK